MARAPERNGAVTPPVTPTPRPGPSPTPPRAPVKKTPAPTGTSPTGGSRPAPDHALVSGGPFWGNPDDPGYAQQNIVTIHTDGLSFQVNAAIATQMAGLIHDLVLAGYHPRSVQGYNNRDITAGSGKSNHAYGAAIDIDPGDNQRYGSAKGGAHKLPDELARTLATKWGMYWGGDYKNSKDYMHFEALGAPRTPGSPPGGTQPVITAAAKAAGATVGTPAGPGTGVSVTAAGAGTPLPANATAQQIKDRVAQDYGYLVAFLDMPEVGKILRDAAIGDWDMATLTGALTKTNWWKTTSATARTWDAKVKTDHATARAEVDAKIAAIQAGATKTGLIISPLRIHDLAVNSLRFGWTDQQLNDALLHEGKLDTSGKTPTTALSTKADLKARANSYLVPLADEALDKWTADVVSGTVTTEAFDAYLKVQAKSLHPEAAVAIDSGVTTATYFDPYGQVAADELEVPRASINFNDPKWSRALYQIDPKTGERKAMSLADWQRTLRSDPVYGYGKTKAAVDQGARFADLLTTTFGKKAAIPNG